jgi:glycosyltransferase involved in cell wall biosynthesis
MKKVLVIAYHYPPLGGGGVFRTLKFTKYLLQFGFRPYVLTVKNPMYATKDPTLVKEIPSEARIFASFSFEHRILRASRLLNIDPEWFFIPDVNVGWLPCGTYVGNKIIRQENIDVIYATAPVFTSLLIGYLLKRKTQKPFVVDFRDPWTLNPFKKFPTEFHERIENRLEKKVLMSADYVITVSQPYREKLIEKYPFLKSKCEVIMNGFDSDDFRDLKRLTLGGKFRILHTGSLYGLRTPKYFLFALQKLFQEKTQLRKQIEVKFVGNYGKETPILVDKLGLNDVVELVGYIPHKECLELMVNSHILLLIVASEGYHTSGIVTGKLFEYLASGRPVLALAPKENIVADIVRSANAGLTVSSENVEPIKDAILELYNMWKEGKSIKEKGDISIYDRRFLTQRLAQIFENVLSEKSNVRNEKLQLRG